MKNEIQKNQPKEVQNKGGVKMIVKFQKTFFIIFLIILLISPALAQRQTGSLEGKVVDIEKIPLPGVMITLSSPALLGTQEFISSDTGDFRFIALSPGVYSIRCELDGFKIVVREGLAINVGKTTIIEVIMESSDIKEEVTVTAAAPVVDVKSSKLAVSFTKEQFQHLPTGRSVYSLINSAPGAVQDYSYTAAYQSVHGSPVSQNFYSLDGLNMTGPVVGDNLSRPDMSAIEEMEMEAGAHLAEVPTSGAYINIVTRSGGNEFHGEGTVYYFNESLVDRNFSQEQLDSLGIGGPTFDKDQQDFSGSIGGPIFKDKLWFFLNGRYGSGTYVVSGFPEDVWYKSGNGMGKLTYQLHEKIKIMGNYNFYNAHNPYTFAGRWRAPEACIDLTENIQSLNTQLNLVVSPNSFLDIRGMFIWALNSNLQRPEATVWNYDRGTGMTTGAYYFSQRLSRKRMSFATSYTHFIDSFLAGSHELKFGLELERARYNNWIWAKEPLLTTSWNGSPYYFGGNIGYFAAYGIPSLESEGKDAAVKNLISGYHLYIQDQWTIKERLTLNLGLRFDSHTGSFDAQYSAEVPYWHWIDPDFFARKDYAEVKNVVGFQMLSPRFGLVYDIFGNGKTIAKASYSRYMDSLLISGFQRANPNILSEKDYIWYDLNWDGQRDTSDYYQEVFTTGREDLDYTELIDQNGKTPYWNEFIIGIDHELLPQCRLGVSYIYKSNKDIWDDEEKNADLNWARQLTVTDPGYDGLFGTSDDSQLTVWDRTRPQEPTFSTNPKGAYRKYRGFEVVFEKRMSNRWQFLGSIVYSKAWGTLGNYYWSAFQSTDAFDTPNYLVNRDGRLDSDRPLVLKLQGTYQLPYGINLSALFIHSSGSPFARQVAVWVPGASSYVGVNAEPSGSRREPSWNNLNLRLEKEFALGNFGKLGLFVDAFNALNRASLFTSSVFHGYIEADGSFTQAPTWQSVAGVSNPRYIKLGARFMF